MKTTLLAVLAPSFSAILNSQVSTAVAPSTAFAYQGRMNVGGCPVAGRYDLEFTMFNATIGGSQTGSTMTNGAGGACTLLETLQPAPPVPNAIYATNANAAGTAELARFSSSAGAATTANSVANGSVTGAGIAPGRVVKSINGLPAEIAKLEERLEKLEQREQSSEIK